MRSIIAALSIVMLIACADVPDTADSTTADDRAADGARGGEAGATGAGASVAARPDDATALRNIVFVGTSLTAGYGVGSDVAFPALVQQRINAASLPFRVTNAGISGETSAGGLRRIDWVLQNPVDVLVLELGANDGLRALDPDSMKRNLRTILQRTRAAYPDAAIVIAGMEAPPNLGVTYTTRFRAVQAELAAEFDATLIPFLLDGVAGVARLNQSDGIHPNADGHRVLADQVWVVLQPLLVARSQQSSRPPK